MPIFISETSSSENEVCKTQKIIILMKYSFLGHILTESMRTAFHVVFYDFNWKVGKYANPVLTMFFSPFGMCKSKSFSKCISELVLFMNLLISWFFSFRVRISTRYISAHFKEFFTPPPKKKIQSRSILKFVNVRWTSDSITEIIVWETRPSFIPSYRVSQLRILQVT